MEIDLFEIFCMGIDYGQLLAEQERDVEDWADAFQGYVVSQKYAMPSQIAPRRQPRSKEWREAKQNSFKTFMDILVKTKTSNEFIFIK